jgi:hypothetical protein
MAYLFFRGVADALNFDFENKRLPGKRMIAVEADNTVINAGHSESDFLPVFVLANDAATDLGGVPGWQFIQWNLVNQINVEQTGEG